MKRSFILLGIIWFAVSASGNGFATYLPILLKERQEHVPGGGSGHNSVYMALILSSIIGIPGVAVASVAVDSEYFGRRVVMFLSTLLASLSFVLFLFAENSWQVTVASCVQNFVIQSSWAAVVTLTSETPPTTHRARVVGGANFIKAISGIVGPYFCGIFAGTDPTLPVLTFAAIMFVASMCALFLPREERGVELVDVMVVVDGRRSGGGGGGAKISSMRSPLL